jgi:hypothetical protein
MTRMTTMRADPDCPCQQPEPPTELTLRQLWSLGWRPGLGQQTVGLVGSLTTDWSGG